MPAPCSRRRAAAVVVAFVLALACARPHEPFHVAAADPATRRTTPAGDVVGGKASDEGAVAWLGIPYAAPPVGELRWRAPRPPAAWSGVREALRYGNACPQYTSPFGGIDGPEGTVVGDEDCLTLNVFAPANATSSSRLPVMVWIHGGGNSIGRAAFYDGARLAASQQVVVVTVQYRLGPLGWFRNAALQGAPGERSGDFALLDLVRALEWVRDAGPAFGGDPGRVTIFGESAGGQNVYLLLVSPLARGLFHRAIVESGGAWGSSAAEAEHRANAREPGAAQSSEEIVLRLLARQHGGDVAAAEARRRSMSDADVAAFLRGLPARDVVAAYAPQPGGMIDLPRAIRDGEVVPAEEPLERLGRADGWNRVPVLVGTNRDEEKLFLFPDPHRITRRLWIFPRFVDEPRYLASADYVSRMWKATGADEPASAMARTQPGVWVYRFDWDEEPTIAGADLAKMLGAAHGFEIPFVFGHWDLGREGSRLFTAENAPGRDALSSAMMRAWAAFARDGVPDPAWPAWKPDAPATVVLDTPAGGGVRAEPVRETREAVIAAVDQDPRLPTARERCGILRELAAWRRGSDRAAYAARAECASYPYDTYPWT